MTLMNILLITTDQQSATMMSCTGNPDVQTPHLDALAADGVRFEKAYAAQPLCVPQRSTWYTGRMPHEHGITFNAWDEGQTVKADVMMGQIFRDAGYATGYSGKWHVVVPEADVERHGFEWRNNIRSNGADKGIAPDFEAFLEQKQSLYDESARVPFLVCRPGSSMARVDETQLVNAGIDLIPTLCGLAEVDCPAPLAGTDWSAVLADPTLPPQRDHVVVETEFGTYGKPAGILGRAIRTSRYKYMVYSRGEHGEFFVDMEADPGETTNLTGDPAHEAALERHRELLRDYIRRTDDIFPIKRVSAATIVDAQE